MWCHDVGVGEHLKLQSLLEPKDLPVELVYAQLMRLAHRRRHGTVGHLVPQQLLLLLGTLQCAERGVLLHPALKGVVLEMVGTRAAVPNRTGLRPCERRPSSRLSTATLVCTQG
jgi:hypothetical protein